MEKSAVGLLVWFFFGVLFGFTLFSYSYHHHFLPWETQSRESMDSGWWVRRLQWLDDKGRKEERRWEREVVGKPKPQDPSHGPEEEDEIINVRGRRSISGFFPIDKKKMGEGWKSCVQDQLRWEFTMGGRVIVNGERDDTGRPQNPAKCVPEPNMGIAKEQIYAKMHEKKILKVQCGTPVWSREVFDLLLSELKEGKDISCSSYPKSAQDIQIALNEIGIRKTSLTVIMGSVSPWIESILIFNGIEKVVTADWNLPISDHPQVETVHVLDLMKSKNRSFDVLISYSSLEHDGLGRYGDPIDPTGDISALEEYSRLLKPGGYLLLAVPSFAYDALYFPSFRGYGPYRLVELIRKGVQKGYSWEYLRTVNLGKVSLDFPLNELSEWQPIAIYQKVKTPDLKTILDCGKDARAVKCVPKEKHVWEREMGRTYK